jgi:hypothetical protein
VGEPTQRHKERERSEQEAHEQYPGDHPTADAAYQLREEGHADRALGYRLIFRIEPDRVFAAPACHACVGKRPERHADDRHDEREHRDDEEQHVDRASHVAQPQTIIDRSWRKSERESSPVAGSISSSRPIPAKRIAVSASSMVT